MMDIFISDVAVDVDRCCGGGAIIMVDSSIIIRDVVEISET
jgi:hypothetical protein